MNSAIGKTLVIMAGGTGGHIFPALAVAKKMRSSGWRVLWLGDPTRMEGRISEANGFKLIALHFVGVRRRGLLAKLGLPWRFVRAFWLCYRAFGTETPDLVLGFGGYISFPGGVAARCRRIPLVIHEANAIAGLSNRLLAPLASAVACGFPATLKHAVVTGNPLRDEFCRLPPPEQRYFARGETTTTVLVVGGSLGAQALNEQIPAGIAAITPPLRPRIIHQSGRGQLEALKARYADLGVHAECVEFIDEMAAYFARADLVICRSGALTVSELAAAGVASALVPYPYAVDDHQRKNADYLIKVGAAFLLAQSELTPTSIERIALLKRPQLARMASLARAQAKLDATEQLIHLCTRLAHRATSS